MTIFLIIASFFSLFYLCATIFLYFGLKQIAVTTTKHTSQNLTFSVVIAAHNEESNIAACLASVLTQSIDASRYEVIVVNDRSADPTADIAQSFAQTHANLVVLTITQTPPGWSPKKYAVSQGIARARNDIVVFTDADCRVPAAWLETIERCFDATVGLVQGITTYSRPHGMNRIFFGLQSLDFLSHGIVAAAAIGCDFPLNSNANNFAFRKTAFREVGGYGLAGSVVSGDDDLLLQRIWKSNTWKVRYMADQSGAVQTFPVLTVGALFEQRKRWGSKTVHYNTLQTLLLSGIFIFYCCLATSILMAPAAPPLWLVAAAMVLVKLCGEAALLVPGTALLHKKELRAFILPASLLQLPLVIAAVLAGVFGKFGWKGQTFKRTMDKPR